MDSGPALRAFRNDELERSHLMPINHLNPPTGQRDIPDFIDYIYTGGHLVTRAVRLSYCPVDRVKQCAHPRHRAQAKMCDMAADNPRTTIVHKGVPISELCKMSAMRLCLGPALVPMVSERAMKAADRNKKHADKAVAKCVHRRGVQLAETIPMRKQSAGEKIENALGDCEFGRIADVGKGRPIG